MATDPSPGSTNESDEQQGARARRKIPGNLPYTNTPGVLSRILEKLPITEKPSVVNADFLSTVLEIPPGSAKPIIPLLKATGLLNQSGSPSEIYSQFQTDGGRSGAALSALKSGFSEIFKRNQFAHKADEKALIDIIVSITGLPKADNIVRSIFNTFFTFQKYARSFTETVDSTPNESKQETAPTSAEKNSNTSTSAGHSSKIGLVYNINIVLPETTNIEVYNSIFRSLKSNILQ